MPPCDPWPVPWTSAAGTSSSWSLLCTSSPRLLARSVRRAQTSARVSVSWQQRGGYTGKQLLIFFSVSCLVNPQEEQHVGDHTIGGLDWWLGGLRPCNPQSVGTPKTGQTHLLLMAQLCLNPQRNLGRSGTFLGTGRGNGFVLNWV